MQILILISKLLGLLILLQLLREPIVSLSNFLKFYRRIYSQDRTDWKRRKLRWYILVHLPQELTASLLTFIYIFFLFNWRASWILLIAISGFFFKRIIQDPLYILHTYILSLIFKTRNRTQPLVSSNIYPSAIYMPHLGHSRKEIQASLSTLFLSYLNNPCPQLSLIYHSDNREPELIFQALKTAKHLKQELGIEDFYFFQRNIQSPERNFLGKPGAYLADYQFLFTGISHPLIYLEKEWDARLEVKFKLDSKNRILEEKSHIPFQIPQKLEEGFEHFIYYPLNKETYFLKESHYIQTSSQTIYPAKIETKIYLISKNNPEKRYLLYMGGIYSLDGELILAPKDWEMQIDGKITLRINRTDFPQESFQIFAQKLIYLAGEKYFLDPELNIRDSQFQIFLEKGSYSLKKKYQLYRRQHNYLQLVEQDFSPDRNKITGEDFRRSPLEPMHKVPSEVIERLLSAKIIDHFEKSQLEEFGIWGNLSKIASFKYGWEDEFLIPDKLVNERLFLKGGYYLIEKEKLKRDKFYSPERAIQLGEKESKINFPLITLDGNELAGRELKGKVLVQAPFISYLKTSDLGYIANEKDNFFLFQDKLLFQDKERTLVVCSNPVRLEKRLIYPEPATGELKSLRLISAPGSYQIKADSILLRKKILPKIALGYFESDGLKLFHPYQKKILKLKHNFFLNEYGIWEENFSSQIKLSPSLKFKAGYIFEEETLASKGAYNISGDQVKVAEKTYPLGIGLYYNGQPLKCEEKFLKADISLLIINQIDSDGEFLKDSLKGINSILSYQCFLDKFEYGMVQPEISFANSSESLFARLLSWAHEEFKFAERAFFQAYQEGNSYGKVCKLLPLYLGNILFKEAIPAIARTHDHWEAMQLRVMFKPSHFTKKSKLVENVPSNFYSFLKRKQGWLAGDLLLLELESKLSLPLNLLRAGVSFIQGKFLQAKFWFNYLKAQLKFQRQFQVLYSALGSQRIQTLKRTTLSTSYLLLWLLISGWLVLLIPGSLTAKNILLSWLFFLSSIFLIVILPKFLIPLSGLLLQKIKRIDSLWLIFSSLGTIYLIRKYLLLHSWFLALSALLGYSYILIRGFFLPLSFIVFGSRRHLRVRILGAMLSSALLVLLLNWYEILYLLSNSPSFYWLVLLLLRELPLAFSYLIPIWLLAHLSSLGKGLISTFKEGIKEITATTSTLLMLLIYEPLHISRLIVRFALRPFSRIQWLPQSYFDAVAVKINSVFKSYYHFYLPPLLSLIFIFLPIKLHLLSPKILSFGWPIFIWSWLLGPFWAYWTQRHRRNLERITPEILILRKLLDKNLNYATAWGKEFYQLIQTFDFQVEEEERVKLYIYFLTQKAREQLPAECHPQLERTINELIKNSADLRVVSWESLAEFSRAKAIRKFAFYLEPELIKEIEATSWILFQMLKKGWAEVEWTHLNKQQKERILRNLSLHYLNPYQLL